jgi:predicted ArsR family transcriptional regulator
LTFARWDRRFFASTRGKIVLLVRRAAHTVEELAQALGLTDNAVRAHLAGLERDGLVEQRGIRPSGGKPAYLYTLTADAETLFPKAYAPVLDRLLDIMGEELPPEAAADLLRKTGRRLGGERRAGHPERDRVAAAVAVLEGLGGVVDVEEDANGRVVLVPWPP